MTARVKVLFHAMFKDITGSREIMQELTEGTMLRDLLDVLAQKYGRDFKEIVDSNNGQVNIDALVMINGQSIRKTEVLLKDGDVIMISVPIGGG